MKGFDVSEWVCDPASFDPFPLTGSIDDELYEKGLYAAAFNGFFDAAEKGDPVAQFKVGYMYYYGQGLLVIPEKEVAQFKKLLVAFYEGEDIEIIKNFLKERCWKNF